MMAERPIDYFRAQQEAARQRALHEQSRCRSRWQVWAWTLGLLLTFHIIMVLVRYG